MKALFSLKKFKKYRAMPLFKQFIALCLCLIGGWFGAHMYFIDSWRAGLSYILSIFLPILFVVSFLVGSEIFFPNGLSGFQAFLGPLSGVILWIILALPLLFLCLVVFVPLFDFFIMSWFFYCSFINKLFGD